MTAQSITLIAWGFGCFVWWTAARAYWLNNPQVHSEDGPWALGLTGVIWPIALMAIGVYWLVRAWLHLTAVLLGPTQNRLVEPDIYQRQAAVEVERILKEDCM